MSFDPHAPARVLIRARGDSADFLALAATWTDQRRRWPRCAVEWDAPENWSELYRGHPAFLPGEPAASSAEEAEAEAEVKVESESKTEAVTARMPSPPGAESSGGGPGRTFFRRAPSRPELPRLARIRELWRELERCGGIAPGAFGDGELAPGGVDAANLTTGTDRLGATPPTAWTDWAIRPPAPALGAEEIRAARRLLASTHPVVCVLAPYPSPDTEIWPLEKTALLARELVGDDPARLIWLDEAVDESPSNSAHAVRANKTRRADAGRATASSAEVFDWAGRGARRFGRRLAPAAPGLRARAALIAQCALVMGGNPTDLWLSAALSRPTLALLDEDTARRQSPPPSAVAFLAPDTPLPKAVEAARATHP